MKINTLSTHRWVIVPDSPSRNTNKDASHLSVQWPIFVPTHLQRLPRDLHTGGFCSTPATILPIQMSQIVWSVECIPHNALCAECMFALVKLVLIITRKRLWISNVTSIVSYFHIFLSHVNVQMMIERNTIR